MSNFDPNEVIKLYDKLVKEANDRIIDYGSFKTGIDSFNWKIRNDMHSCHIYLDLETSFKGEVSTKTFLLDKRMIESSKMRQDPTEVTNFIRNSVIEYLCKIITYDLYKNYINEISLYSEK